MVDENTYESDERHLPRLTRLPSPGSPSNELDALDDAASEGKVFVRAAIGVAVAWWLASFIGMFALLGITGLSALPPAALLAGTLALLIPGLLILMAGFLAKAHARASATNGIVLRAAARLLSPVETSGHEARTFADLMKTSAGEVDRAMAHALSSMKAMSGEISEERQRLETVAHEAAKQAVELASRLSHERSALQSLGDEIRHQSEIMSDAIPRQAEKMRYSARQAAADIAEADEELEGRLGDLRQASTTLSERVSALDEMSVEAAKRSESLIFAVSRMEEKLEQSRKMVDQALRASEMVAASASTTGDRITEAVSAAMENARIASQEIQADARDAAEKAAETLAMLKRAGEEAAEAVHQARTDAEALSRLDVTRESPASGTGDHIPLVDDGDEFSETPEPVQPASTEKPRNEDTDSDLFGFGSDGAPGAEENGSEQEADETIETEVEPPAEAGKLQSSETSSSRLHWKERMPPYLKPVGGSEAVNLESDVDDPDEENERVDAPSELGDRPLEDARRERWSNILADVEREERPPMPREENAEEMIHRLMNSGIRLTETFRPRDKKKIANAARKGDGLRRKAVVDAASRQVQRVQKRLDSDEDLMTMAREFLTVEEADALSALDKTSNSSRNASARLSAFLLIDAALG